MVADDNNLIAKRFISTLLRGESDMQLISLTDHININYDIYMYEALTINAK